MRFLFLNQFAPPDLAPTGLYLYDVAESMAGRGHQVVILASRRRYSSHASGTAKDDPAIAVTRVGLGQEARSGIARIVGWCEYFLLAAWEGVRQPRPHAIIALTTPPWIGLLARFLGLVHRCPVIHWVMDVYPDALVAHGSMTTRGLPWRLLVDLSHAQLDDDARVIAIGECMAKRLQRSWGASPQVIPLWCRDDLRFPSSPSPAAPGRLKLLYSGNMGHGHGIEDFLAAARHCGGDGPRWIFSGHGPGRKKVEEFISSSPDHPVEIKDPVPQAMLAEHLASVDVHLVSVRPGWEGVIVPSKVQGIFASGRPVIVVAPPESEPALWTVAAGAGWVVAPGDVDGLVRAVEAARDPLVRQRCGERAKAFSLAEFGKDANTRRIERTVLSAIGSGACP